MTHRAVGTSLAMVCLVLLASAAAAQEIEKKPVEFQQLMTTDGDVLYGEFCAVCHGASGTGGGPAAVAMAIAVPDLTALAAGNGGDFPAERVEEAITGSAEMAAHGSREMPIWGQAFAEARPGWGQAPGKEFAMKRIQNLVKYIETLQKAPEEGAE